MKSCPLENRGRRGRISTVEGIRQEREGNAGEVGTDLVRIASDRANGKQCGICQAAENCAVRAGGLTVAGIHHRSVTAIAVDPEGRGDDNRLPGGKGLNNGVVFFVNFPILKSLVQRVVSSRGAGEKDGSAGILVQPMHNPEPAKFRLQYRAEMRQGWIIAIRKTQQPGRFIHAEDVLIEVEDGWNFGRRHKVL